MSTTPHPVPPLRRARAGRGPGAGRPSPSAAAQGAAALVLAAALAVAVNAGVAAAAVALGADARFGPLHPVQFTAWSAGGVLLATAGWMAIRHWTRRPRAVLAWAVPSAVLVSLVPDVVLLVAPWEAHASTTGVLALMLMHLVVAAAVLPVLRRWLPLPANDLASHSTSR